ncbi:MAG: hypothetical protein L6R48_05175 [Planctomycetes bacterium]|nr:hypothetical protein [Planctomycetota bacterium]
MPLLYPTSRTPALDPQTFRAPGAEFRGAPFWSWNCKLDAQRLIEQFDHLAEMGMGGAHLHCRVGLATEYLGDEFMALVRQVVAHAKAKGLRAFLYDEDRWPSGFAGGLVTVNPEHREQELVFARTLPAADEAGEAIGKRGAPRQLARYAVRLAGGRLAAYRRLAAGAKVPKGHEEWFACARTNERRTWFNGQTYVDTMSRPAIEEFIRTTHERYRAAVGEDFGGVIPSIFTDEPAVRPAEAKARAEDGGAVRLPWTTTFPDTFAAAHGFDLLDRLPELFWEAADGSPARTRWCFFDHVASRFAEAYAGTIGAWCERHGLLHTGHLMYEDSLSHQTAWVADAMRSYRGFQLPGIDTLCDCLEYTTAKQAQSVARQDGREGLMSELYGVTGWDFDFTGHKRHGDWQAALGITLRVHHLAWVSMAGEAKRDYPAPIDEHSTWFREYTLVEDHFARLNTVLTRGTPICRVAVVHPVESSWLAWGDQEHCGAERQDRDRQFADLTRWLLHGLVDFDFLCEGLLPGQQAAVKGKRLVVGKMAYDAVVVPNLRTIRTSTLKLLEAFAKAGGTVVFAGQVPELVDVQPSAKAARLARSCAQVSFTRSAILDALEAVRELAVIGADGAPVDQLLCQLRQDGAVRHLFLCNTSREHAHHALVSLRGSWQVTQLDTLTGEQRALESAFLHGCTQVRWACPQAGHLLLRLERAPKRAEQVLDLVPPAPPRQLALLSDPVPVELSEPNVLLLDQGEFRFDDGAWEPSEELLRIGNLLRARIGLPAVGGEMVQPWCAPRPPATHRVSLRFRLDVREPVRGAHLALEHAGDSRLVLDGRTVDAAPDGHWVDAAIGTIPLPDLAVGTHVLEVTQPLGAATNLEWMYLLGDFSVTLAGRSAHLGAPVRTLSFGDWTTQGLPFYAGNVTYRCRFQAEGGALRLAVPRFRAPLLTVAVDGTRVGPLAFPPYALDLGSPKAGAHELAITAFGSRINSFGALHHADHHSVRWYGPHAWRTTGADWTYNYQLRPCGIMGAPALLAGG